MMVKQENVIEISPHNANSSGIAGFEWVQGYDGYDKEVEYLIDGIIPAESFGVVYGGSGTFKSFLAFSWAQHIALGKDWGKHKVTQKSVLYIVAEGGRGAPRRVKAWCDMYNNGVQPKGLYRLNNPVHLADFTQRYMLEKTVEDICEKTGDEIGLIIIDTLARCFAGGDENSTKDMNDFIAGCDTIKAKTNATILVIHHSGKNEDKGGRGSSALRAACDFEYKVKRPKDGGESLILSCEKMKDDEPITTRAFKLEKVFLYENEHGREINSLCLIDEADESIDYMIQFKEAGGGASKQQGFIWYSAKQTLDTAEPVALALLRSKFHAEFPNNKHFSRELNKLIENKMLVKNGEEILFPNLQK